MKSVENQSLPSGAIPSSSSTTVRTRLGSGPDADRQLAHVTNQLQKLWQGAGPSPVQIGLLFVAAIVAMGVASYLAYTSFTSGSVAGCDGGLFDCASVLKSRWSNWFSIPVSVLAGINYVGFLGSLVWALRATTEDTRQRSWFLVHLFGFSAGLAGLWFMSLQFFVLQHICPYCMAAHICGLVISAVLIWMRPIGAVPTVSASALALVGLGAMAAGQMLGPEPVSYEIIDYSNPSTMEPGANGESATAAPVAPVGEEDDAFLFAPPDEDEFLFAPPTEDEGGPSDAAAPTDRLKSSEPSGAPTESGDSDEIESETQIEREGPVIFQQPATETSAWQFGSNRATFLAVLFRPHFLTQGLVVATQESSTEAGRQEQNDRQDEAKQGDDPQDEAKEEEGQQSKKRRLVAMSGGSIKLDCAQWPMIGTPDAKYVFVELFDYCCPHCRKTHKAISEVRRQMNGDLGVIVLPVPLNTNCNRVVHRTGAKFFESCELARLAVAMWRIDPAKFEQFHEWMFVGHDAPRYADALAKAKTLVDAEALDEQLRGRVVRGYIAKHVEIYRRVGGGTIPKLMFPRTGIVGEYTSARSLREFIEREARVDP